jgi:hypothetical protein
MILLNEVENDNYEELLVAQSLCYYQPKGTEDCVRWITQSEGLIILHILRKLNLNNCYIIYLKDEKTSTPVGSISLSHNDEYLPFLGGI